MSGSVFCFGFFGAHFVFFVAVVDFVGWQLSVVVGVLLMDVVSGEFVWARVLLLFDFDEVVV